MIKRFPVRMLKAVYWNITWYFICFLSFFLIFQTYIQGADALKLINLRTIGDNTSTRIIAVFNAEPNFYLQISDSSSRLVINLPPVDFSTQNTSLNKQNILSSMLSDIHYNFSDTQTSYITLTSKTSFIIENSTVQKLENGLWQVLIDITQNVQKKSNEVLTKQQKTNQNIKKQSNPKHYFHVVLDPGHGGIDSGAQGITGILEKNITLAFARALQNELKKDSDINVTLTRDSDVFLRLSERVKKAQNFNADLFISIHADSINIPSLRGATVYTLSDKASDAIAKTLAEVENNADLLGGLLTEESHEVTDILIDLARRETHILSLNFADRVILNLSNNNINLIKNPHRYADFQVLKAPDVPSVLIEIGYLSNKEDEKLFNNSQWRNQIVVSLAHSIRQFSQYRKEIMQSP
ncbi:N-acetylmuramoyl-L-alanine amidase family protein [Bartonella sp. WD16.2]|uniref:N-acetylmuramoyl-L-alanine amidase family protein n=1 Tax=Bartonella sp. WD16.2 TaxID=1933904 RepID=UPI000999B095|nr:N-acetylmuramoyl-L-alanine amidase [Bartonella sp. WD16.2]AQX19822.1 N-acetylmuramoyl-L-alanine amidase [Bartonella sp. WD16.2]